MNCDVVSLMLLLLTVLVASTHGIGSSTWLLSTVASVGTKNWYLSVSTVDAISQNQFIYHHMSLVNRGT